MQTLKKEKNKNKVQLTQQKHKKSKTQLPKWRLISEYTKSLPYLSPDEELFEAARYNDIKRVKELIAVKANVNAKRAGIPSLVAAAVHDHIKVVELLLDAGADINATQESGATALIMAVMCSNRDVVKLLVDRGADIYLKDTSDMKAIDYVNKHKKDGVEDKMFEYLREKDSKFSLWKKIKKYAMKFLDRISGFTIVCFMCIILLEAYYLGTVYLTV